MTAEQALEAAREAHRGQKDKGGAAYIDHPKAVAVACRHYGEDTVVVALLHDVIEETDHQPEGLTDAQLSALVAITRKPHETYADYIARCGLNAIARRVKVEDLRHNLSAERMEGLPPEEAASLRKRYWKALASLGAEVRP